jgi:hypothetical protein
MRLKTAFALAGLVLISGNSVLADSHKWSPGWDNFTESLNLKTSTVTWAVNATTGKLTVTYKLVGARPNKLYQVGVHVYCPSGTGPATFGQFPVLGCGALTRQGVTANVYAVELGVVTTDAHGNGLFAVAISGLAPDAYQLTFDVRDGAGCDLTGGSTAGSVCALDFQSPGPTFGNAITITIP